MSISTNWAVGSGYDNSMALQNAGNCSPFDKPYHPENLTLHTGCLFKRAYEIK
jgi:hypothetical protein